MSPEYLGKQRTTRTERVSHTGNRKAAGRPDPPGGRAPPREVDEGPQDCG